MARHVSGTGPIIITPNEWSFESNPVEIRYRFGSYPFFFFLSSDPKIHLKECGLEMWQDNMRFSDVVLFMKTIDGSKQCLSKDSFLRALREFAPEMELFLENHGQYIKNFVIKLIHMQSCTFRHFTKKNIVKNMSEKTFRHIILRKLSPKHVL